MRARCTGPLVEHFDAFYNQATWKALSRQLYQARIESQGSAKRHAARRNINALIDN
jgi:hypothetical protein